MSRVLIIAEAGVNHNGDMALALRLVDAAADAGADVVKFQTFKAERLVTPGADKAAYQKAATGAAESQFAMLKRLELDAAAHETLMARCRERGIAFLSTPFDEQSADMLASMGLTIIKIPSGEITNLPYLRHVGALGRRIVLSTGMCALDEVADALRVLEAAGTPLRDVTLLHCNTQYPTPDEDANLRAIRTLAEAFPACAVGYSDHTRGIACPIAATALGATVIEKHFTLDRRMEGPDHAASLEPGELAALVAGVRTVEAALGHGRKEPSPSERENILVARRYLVAARDIAAGEAYSPENVAARRTGSGGVSPMRWDEVMGRRAPRAFAAGEKIEP
ncbi:MAG TPA: N-acetylneuraminate synthase [Desulfovibrio sp.]|uniref:N-acetylneuraminate synthase n=1 Tax=Desulfovibrio sp. TaxID=885 RepID=UPI002D063CC2|nr:N-acetylneuraminate synthase [Desulfovibrio sp.]HMM39163.1 N-acetylneuraminate synthase [Desulfovibrio sp.]